MTNKKKKVETLVLTLPEVIQATKYGRQVILKAVEGGSLKTLKTPEERHYKFLKTSVLDWLNRLEKGTDSIVDWGN